MSRAKKKKWGRGGLRNWYKIRVQFCFLHEPPGSWMAGQQLREPQAIRPRAPREQARQTLLAMVREERVGGGIRCGCSGLRRFALLQRKIQRAREA